MNGLINRLSEMEEGIRDRVVGPAVDFLIPGCITPNHITFFRAVLILFSILVYIFNRYLLWQFLLLIAASVTDFVDGILARRRNMVSLCGAYLDHAVDWFLGAWTGFLVLWNGLLNISIILFIIIPQVGIMIVDRIRASRLNVSGKGKRVITIAMGAANFRVSALSRIQFVAVLIGFFLLLLSAIQNSDTLQQVGYYFLYIMIALSWIVLVETTLKLIMKTGTR